MEVAGIVFFFAAVGALARRVAASVSEAVDIAGVALATAAGYVLADFLSGLAHWAGDTLGDENTPILGKNVVTPFRQHHVDPKAITRHDFIETNGNSCLSSSPVLAALLLWMPAAGPGRFAGVALLSAAWFVFCTNQFHKWAHADRVPRVVGALQRARVILSPEHHGIHHALPHDKYYCITTGWLNPLLHKLGFFRACEALVARIRPSFLHLAERTPPPGGGS